MLVQLDFFEETETTLMKKEIEQIGASVSRVRKGLFARHGDLNKRMDELTFRMEIIEKGLCLKN